MNAQILVIGASGNVGGAVVRELLQRGVKVRVAARDIDPLLQVFGNRVDAVAFDFTKPDTFADAFAGIDKMFLVRPPALANVQRDIAPAVHSAVAAGVRHIVFLSLQGVERNRFTPHFKIEQLIKAAGVEYTFLRAGFFMQNLTTTHAADIRDHHEIPLPVGKAKTAFIDVRDIGAVGATVLTEAGHANQAYTLTGGDALDYYQVAAILTSTLGRPIRYTNPAVLRFVYNEIAKGRPFPYTLVMAALYTLTRFGNAKEVTPDVAHLLGRPPITFDQFVWDHRDIWQ